MSIAPLSHQPFIAPQPGPEPKKPLEAPSHDSQASSATPPESPTTSSGTVKGGTASTTQPSAEVAEKIERLTYLLGHQNLVDMMAAPYAPETAQSLREIRELSGYDALNSLTGDPREQAQLRSIVGQVLSEKTIRSLQREGAAGPNPHDTSQYLGNYDADVPWKGVQQMHAEQRKQEIKIVQRTRQSDTLAKHLIAIGQPYQTAKTEEKPESAPVAPGNGPLVNDKNPEQSPREKPTPRVAPHVQTPNKPSTADEVKTGSTEQRIDDVHPTLKRIDDLLSRDSLIKLMRDPNAEQSKQRIEELERLLSDESLDAWSIDPYMQAQLKDHVRKILSPENLQALRREEGLSSDFTPPSDTQPQPKPTIDKQPEDATAGPGNAPLATNETPEHSTHETPDIPRPYNRSSDNQSVTAGGPSRTFSYNNIHAAPSQVMNFTSGTDKIDLTGIRTQLGDKPLALVEHLSGNSGEITINYYAGTNTSFVTISRSPGEPPFELKVAGEVRYQDLKT